MIHINQDDIGIIAFFDFSNTIQFKSFSWCF